MSRQTARQVLEQFNMRPSLVARRYAGLLELPEVTSTGLIGDIRELAEADPVAEIGRDSQRRATLAMAYGYPEPMSDKPFVFTNGKAIIPVHGMLINRFSYSWDYVTGYNFIRNQIAAALEDPDVDGIVYDVNTYGGTVAGCRETADAVYAASKKGGGKPSLAVIDANCFSAGYYLMSAADSISLTPTGGAGSIGVMMMHMDFSGMLEKIGIKATMLFEGAHKVDGNPYEPLSPEVTSDIQAELSTMYDDFVATVVRNRPSLTEKQVRDTQARAYFIAAEALAAGLVDNVKTPPQALEQFFSDSPCDDVDDEPQVEVGEEETNDDEDEDDGETPQHEGSADMNVKPGETAAAAPDAAAIAQAAQTARAAERTRVAAILGHADAVGRSDLASHLAMNTDMDVEAAAAILKVSPKAAAPAAPAPKASAEPMNFRRTMNADSHPNVGTGDEELTDQNGQPQQTVAQRVLANQAKAAGRRPEAAKH